MPLCGVERPDDPFCSGVSTPSGLLGMESESVELLELLEVEDGVLISFNFLNGFLRKDIIGNSLGISGGGGIAELQKLGKNR